MNDSISFFSLIFYYVFVFRKNILDLKIFFGELGYTKITQSPDYPASSMFGRLWIRKIIFLFSKIIDVVEHD